MHKTLTCAVACMHNYYYKSTSLYTSHVLISLCMYYYCMYYYVLLLYDASMHAMHVYL